jgi:tryptophan synthase alpha chain
VEKKGAQHIAVVFTQTRSEKRAALMPYLPLGYPTPGTSLDLVEAAAAGGADMVELGMPFSDPLADGPVIQEATQVALQQGMTTARCLEAAHGLRERGLDIPFVLMGYYSPILAYGEVAFCKACCDCGVDGLIVPDLPPEEGGKLEGACRAHKLALVYLLAPTSPPERIRLVTERSQGFVYLVSVTGITGARDCLPPDLAAFVQRARAATSKPLAVGFGISTPDQARQVAALADGVIVGSALVRRAAETDGRGKVQAFIHELRHAISNGG